MTDEAIPTKEEPGPFDGMENAKPGEPVFTLQGGDPLAAPLVQLWADAARKRAGVGAGNSTVLAGDLTKLIRAACEQVGDHKREELLLRATEAEAISWEMDAYRKGEKFVEKATESYSGYVQSQESKDAAKRTRSLYDLAQNLEEAKFHANETRMALEAAGEFPDAAATLVRIVGELDGVATAIRPKRRADD